MVFFILPRVCNTSTFAEETGAGRILFLAVLCQLVAHSVAFLRNGRGAGDTDASISSLDKMAILVSVRGAQTRRKQSSNYRRLFVLAIKFRKKNKKKAKKAQGFLSPGYLYHPRLEREKPSVKDIFFVLKTVELSWLPVCSILSYRQQEPVELVCFRSAH